MIFPWRTFTPKNAKGSYRPRLVSLEDRSTPSTVNILTDVVDPNDGKTSLREAVALFNTAPDDFGNNSINFDPALNGKTVVLTAGELAVTGKPGATKTELSLDGSFSRVGPVIISGNNASRLFNVSSGITLNINQLKFTGGKADKGGAILNAGTLKLTTLTFDGNEATTADGGGAVYLAATGKLSITGATFSNNKSAGSGGAILDFGSAGIDVTGSTFSGNTAAGFGGAISGGNLNVSNSTFSGNTAGDVGGGLWTNGQLQSTNTTIVLNTATGDKGGGLFVQAGVAKLNNTLVGGNTGGDIGGTVDAGSKNNFIADPATAGGLVNAANGNILGDGAGALLALNKVVAVTLDVNTGFGPLTHAAVPGGPAVDKGDKTLSNNPSDGKPLTTDARGSFSNAAKDTLRIAGENADIGAFEYQNTPPTVNLPTNKLTILEDSTDGFTFTGTGNTITVSDDGIGSTIYDVSLKTDVVVGKISLGTTNGLVGVTGNGTDAIAFTVAKLSDLNAALASLKALAFPDKNGSIGVTVTVNDKSSGPGDALSNFSEAGVAITAIIDPPSITSATTAKDKAVDVVLSRNKVDGNEISHFQVTNLKGGTLSYVGPESVANAAIQVTVGKAFFFAGSFFNLTPDPDTKFTFTPTPGFEGIASFDIQVAQGVYAVDPVGQPPNPAPEFGGPILTSRITVGTPPADTTAPTAKIGTAADVGAAANGAKTYDFTVTYTDDVQIDFSTLDGKDVRVTGPVGFNTLANFVSSDLLNNGSPRTVTYRIVPPGGSWDSTDNGTYTIAVEASQVLDTSKNPVAAGNLGTFTVNLPAPADTTAPMAKLGTAGAVTAAGTTTYDFTVTYSDDVAVDATTLDGKDVRVTGPGTFNQLAAFVKADATGNGTPRTVTYRITPVGGFTTTSNGTYTIAVEASQVLDTSKNAVAAGTLGTFSVNIPAPADTTAPTAKLGTAAAVGDSSKGSTTYDFTVTYTDNVSVDATTFDGKDIRVTGPSGFNQLASFVKADVAGNGTPRLVTYRITPPGGSWSSTGNGTYSISVEGTQVLDTSKNTVVAGALGTFVVSVTATNTPVLVGFPQFVAGSDSGQAGTVQLYNADKSPRLVDPLRPFGDFTGGIRTASADFNRDGVVDIVVGTGPGRATRVLILDGATQKELFAVDPFEASFIGGVYVAVGDVTGDGTPDVAITPDEGGGPRADVYSGSTGFAKVASFFGIDDANFRGGARSSIADMTGDGTGDLIVVAGFGGGPRVAGFNGKSLGSTPQKIFGDFFAFEQTLRNGIFVTAGDINGDGFADLIAGGGPGGGPRVLAFSGKDLTATNQTNVQLANFFGGDVNSRGGIRLAVKNLDGDNRADLVVGAGAGAGSRVTSYLGKNIPTDGPPAENFGFDSVSGFTGGVFVG